MRQLYLSVAVPKLTYGLDVWYTPPAKLEGAKKRTGSVSALKGMQKAQRVATLAITGALRTTPTDILDSHAGILPLELLLLKSTHRAAIRLCTLPDTHPLHRYVEQAAANPPKTHMSAIDFLMKSFKLNPQLV